MRAGRLRHRVTIQAEQVARDTAGGEVVTWVDGVTVWADVRASRTPGETFVRGADQTQAVALYTVRARLIVPLPNVKDRAIWGDYVFDIQNVLDPDGRGRETHLLCEAVLDG